MLTKKGAIFRKKSNGFSLSILALGPRFADKIKQTIQNLINSTVSSNSESLILTGEGFGEVMVHFAKVNYPSLFANPCVATFISTRRSIPIPVSKAFVNRYGLTAEEKEITE